ncbi:MAG: hypothetical protein DRJ03_15355 [Chloroflexi bacterium]|nr:MAG: hypothetical protein DRJ03_15355 [Chloroflexota bacterium]
MLTLHNIGKRLKKQGNSLKREHVSLFTCNQLRALLNRLQFNVKMIEPQGTGLIAVLESFIRYMNLDFEKLFTLLNNLDMNLSKKIMPKSFASGWVILAMKAKL